MEHVEGEWNGFVFKRATEVDADVLSDFMRDSYFADEHITMAIGWSEEYHHDFRRMWDYFLKDDLSFAAVDKESNKVAGARLIFDRKKNLDWTKLFDLKSRQTFLFFGLLDILDNTSNLYEKHNIDTYAELFMTAVAKDFRKRGLVTEMYRRSILLCRSRGFYLAKANFSSPYTRQAALNTGFQEVASTIVKDYKDANGVELIPSAPDLVVSQAVYIL